MKNGLLKKLSTRLDRGALRISGLYLLLGVVWILTSDRTAAMISPDQETFTTISILKGWTYVLVTASLLYFLIVKYIRSRQEVEARLVHTLSQTVISVWEWDLHTNDILWSPVLFDLSGIHKEDLAGKRVSFKDRIHPKDIDNLLESAREAVGKKRLFTAEVRVLDPQGEIRWLSIMGRPEIDQAGDRLYIVGTVQDVTEHKRAEARLRESEERFSQLANHIQEAFWITDIEAGREIYLSPAAERIWGQTIEELMSSPQAFLDSILLEDRPAVEEVLAIQRTGKPTEMEYRIRRTDGTVRWIWDRAFPIADETGRVKTLAGIAVDITERKLVETARTQLVEILESSLNEVYIFDPETLLFLYVNRGALRNLGYSREAMSAMTPLDLKPEFDLASFKDRIEPLVNGERELLVFETVHRRADGSLYPVEVHLQMAAFQGHRVFYATILDITDRRKVEQETRHHLAELEAVYENGLAVGQLHDAHEIGERIIRTFAQHLSWHHVAIRLKHPGRDELELIAFNQPGLGEADRSKVEASLKSVVATVGQGLSGWVIRTGMPFRTGNVKEHPQYVSMHAGVRSGLYMPLKIGGEVTGVISVESEQADAFTPQDERLLATLSNQAAIAFENARLYQAAQSELAERRQIEAARRASEAHYRDLADSITDILFELDQNLCFTHWNKASEMLTGLPPGEVIGKTLREILGSSESQEAIEKVCLQVLLSRAPTTLGLPFLVSDERREFEVSAYPSAQGVSVVAKDVTERERSAVVIRKRFELMEYAAHHTLEEVMRRITDVVSELTGSRVAFLHFIEEDGKTLGLQTWSTEAMRLSSLHTEGRNHASLDEAGVWAEAVRQKRPVLHNDYPGLRSRKGLPDGHLTLERELVIPILRNERIVAVMGLGNKPRNYTQQDLELAARFADFAWDVSERKQMETALAEERNRLVKRVEERTADLSRANASLARALRVKDEFLANMSHELRTPLNAILGLSESLEEQIAGPLNEKQAKYLATISESGHHLLSLINDILDLAKIEAGQITLDINKVDLRSVCQASLRMIRQLSQKKRQQVSLQIEDGIGLIWADERRLKQMIVNLLSNAVKFTPEDGRLGLEVRRDRNENVILFQVWDNGIGISEENLTRLFRPFVQVDSGLDRGTAGTGLGLTLVAQMARLHGGRVEVESRPGEGSRFTIVLPWTPALMSDMVAKLRETGRLKLQNPDDQNLKTILVIEDTQDVVMMIRDYLENSGFRVATARDGLEGIEQARLTAPDVILMDIMMPRMDGLEAARRLRADPQFNSVAIIGMTALAMPNDRARCLEAGMDDYISKPVNLKSLVKTLRTILSNRVESGAP